MLSDKLKQELNKQINIELASAYLYLSMAAYFESRSLDGFGHWMHLQAREEMQHAEKVYKYLLDKGAKVTLLAIEQPRTDFDSIREVFEDALKNEEKLAERFNELSELAREEKDNTTFSFLKWFLDEQVEEVAVCSGIIDKLKIVGEDGYGILLLNNELGSRQPEQLD